MVVAQVATVEFYGCTPVDKYRIDENKRSENKDRSEERICADKAMDTERK